MSLTEAQKAERLNYITGSDAAVICGVSPWGNVVELWQQKLGLSVAENIDHKPAVRAGNYLEAAVAKWWSDETGWKVMRPEIIQISVANPFMAANIDGWVSDPSGGACKPAILEVKTTSWDEGWGAQGENVIPDHYLCQVAHYMSVCDVERAYVAVLIRGVDFRHYTFDRNLKLEEMIIAKEKEFWDCVQTQTPPQPRNVNEVVSLYSQAMHDESLLATHEIEEVISNLKATKEFLKEREIHKERLETIVKAHMKNYDTLIDSTGRQLATWRNVNAPSRFDQETFAKEHKELFDKYRKSGIKTRRFHVK